MSPVSRGRGKKNRSAKGPVGKRAATRHLPASDGSEAAGWPLDGPDVVSRSPVMGGGLGRGLANVADILGGMLDGDHLEERAVAGTSRPSVGISWVTIERWAREKADPPGTGRDRPYRDDAERLTDAQLLSKLRGFGIELDRDGLETLCQDALSAEEVASQLLSRHVSASEQVTTETDWIWLAVLTLWQRWWPAKPCLETLDDKMQAGYEQLSEDRVAATHKWLEAWSEVMQLCDTAGITTIAGFDEQFPMTQSLFNWHQDLELELGNAGLEDPAKLRARITVGEELLHRFTDCDQLAIENWRRAIAEAWFWLGETSKADELFRGWLEDDPQWGYGWIGWASGYRPPPGTNTPTNYQRAEELLRHGYAVTGVRDRDSIEEWLKLTRQKAGRQS